MNALNTLIVCLSVSLLNSITCLAEQPPVGVDDGYDYYAYVFAYEQPRAFPRLRQPPIGTSHTFTTIVGVPRRSGGTISPSEIKMTTISWLPANMFRHPHRLRLREVARGRNFSQAATELIVSRTNENLRRPINIISLGAARVSSELFNNAVAVKAHFNAGEVGYAVHKPRNPDLFNCIEAAAAPAVGFDKLRTGVQRGFDASASVFESYRPFMLGGGAPDWVTFLMRQRVEQDKRVILERGLGAEEVPRYPGVPNAPPAIVTPGGFDHTPS